MNIQNLKENILVKKVLPILKIFDFRKYFFSYLFIASAGWAIFFTIIDLYTIKKSFIDYFILFLLFMILLNFIPLCLIAEIIIRALLKKIFPNNQILIKLENIPQKMTLFWSVIFYILFILSVLVVFICLFI